MLPAKKPPGHRANVPVPLPAASGADVGAHAALARMRCGRASARRARAARGPACIRSTERDGCAACLPGDAPLFARGWGGGRNESAMPKGAMA